jgi:hypothetical protein
MGTLRRRRARDGFDLPLAADRAIALFTPEGERLWVPGWDPFYPGGERSEDAGTVFTTHAHDVETLWVIIGIDRAGATAAYARVSPGWHAGTVRVECTDARPGRCRVLVDYDLTALSEARAAHLDAYRPEPFAEMMEEWRSAIEASLQ